MSVLHPHRSFPEDCLPLEAALWWSNHSELFLRVLTSPKYRRKSQYSSQSENLLIYPPECYRMESKMNGRKSKQPINRSTTSVSKSLPFFWVNVTLTPEDVDILSGEKANLEQLALAYISVGAIGLGLSIKFDFVGKSYTVCIYGPDTPNDMRPCGVSGQSPDLRDAILVCLFKFNNRLQGSFDGVSSKIDLVQSRRFK